ncbi:hypothetical protein AB0H92_16280 [Streptomyces phaeochromogenes]|uniref:hypothetical protein n=1 Tax=Streptomyces phaeochromogenes TaxID=1923 RepID=UPI00340FA1FB
MPVAVRPTPDPAAAITAAPAKDAATLLYGGKPGTVIQVDPHSPRTVTNGDTVNVTLCAG